MRLYCRSWPLAAPRAGVDRAARAGRPLRALPHDRRDARRPGHRRPHAGSARQRPLARTARLHRRLGRSARGPRPPGRAHAGGGARASTVPARHEPRRAGCARLCAPPPRRAPWRHRALAPAGRARRTRAAPGAGSGALAGLAALFTGDGNGPEGTLARPGGVERVLADPLFHRRGTARLSTEVTRTIARLQEAGRSPCRSSCSTARRTGWCRRTGAGGSSPGWAIPTAGYRYPGVPRAAGRPRQRAGARGYRRVDARATVSRSGAHRRWRRSAAPMVTWDLARSRPGCYRGVSAVPLRARPAPALPALRGRTDLHQLVAPAPGVPGLRARARARRAGLLARRLLLQPHGDGDGLQRLGGGLPGR